MNRNVTNLFGVLVVLLVAMGGAMVIPVVGEIPPPLEQLRAERHLPKGLYDAGGQWVSVDAYQRVVSVNPTADHILLELLEPERLVGMTASTKRDHPLGWRFGRRASLESSEILAPILSLHPDLVVVSPFADAAVVSRLREQEIAVFDLGEMRGVEDTQRHIRQLSTLLNVPERGHRLLVRFGHSLSALKQARQARYPVKGMYISPIGDSFFGGSKGTSYGDLLYYGGVDDIAEQHGYNGWPNYGIEQLIELNPVLIVTDEGGRQSICRHSLLGVLAACGKLGRVIELESGLSNDPGLGLVQAAQHLQDRLHR